jgi:hypothetical protein
MYQFQDFVEKHALLLLVCGIQLPFTWFQSNSWASSGCSVATVLAFRATTFGILILVF